MLLFLDSVSSMVSDSPYLQIGLAVSVGLAGVYGVLKQTKIRFRTSRELCQLTLQENELKCTEENCRDFCRFYRGKAVYMWTKFQKRPVQLQCELKADGGKIDKEEIDKMKQHFLDKIKEYLPPAAKNLHFLETLIPFITTTPGMSFNTNMGPTTCLKDPIYVILVSDTTVRVCIIAFQYETGKKGAQFKFLTPNLLTNPNESCNISLIKTFPETPTNLDIIENDCSYIQSVLQNNSWDEFIETKL